MEFTQSERLSSAITELEGRVIVYVPDLNVYGEIIPPYPKPGDDLESKYLWRVELYRVTLQGESVHWIHCYKLEIVGLGDEHSNIFEYHRSASNVARLKWLEFRYGAETLHSNNLRANSTRFVECPNCGESWDETTPGYSEASEQLERSGHSSCIACCDEEF